MELILFIAATNNGGKLKEIKALVSALGHAVKPLREAGIVSDPEESGKTFLENALIKARAVRELAGSAVIADDSGLMVEALGGEPGVHTARYAGEEGDPEKNIDKLLLNMSGLPEGDRRAWFVSVVAAILPDGREITAAGVAEGSIGFGRRGKGGFGYDPVFYLRGGQSFAELSEQRKNEISHRARALRKLGFKLRGIRRVNLG